MYIKKDVGQRFLIFVLLIIFNLTSNSQVRIQGYVTDNNGPIEFASIVLKNNQNQIINHAFSDSTGLFKMNLASKGKYSLLVSMTGHLSKNIDIDFTSDSPILLDTIRLENDIKSLSGIKIIATKKLITRTSQGLIFNASENITLASGTATDLLRNTPTIVVDPEGGISIRGKAPMILINGRNSGIGSLDRIPATSVESIEIINNPNASYDADSEAGIINIRLKKNNLVGSNGSLGIGSGAGSRARFNSTFIYNYMRGKWNIGLSYDNRFAGRTRSANAQRTNFALPDFYYLVQSRRDQRTERTHNGKVNIDFKPNDKSELGLEILVNNQSEDNYETLLSKILNQQKNENAANSRYSQEIRREEAMEAAFYYKRNFNDSRKKISLNLNSAFNFETENTGITTNNIINGDFVGLPYLQKTSNIQPSNIQTLKFDVSYPLNDLMVMEAGYKAVNRSVDANFKTSFEENGTYLLNNKASNDFHFSEFINALYVRMINEKSGEDNQKFHFDAGLRLETTVNSGKLDIGSVNVNNRYLKLFPNLNLKFDADKTQTYRLSLGRRINRPGLGQLNPFVDITDSLNPHGGNPYLKPELINVSELSHQKTWKNISLASSIYYRKAFNTIRSFINVDSTGIGLSVPRNFGSAQNYGLEEMMTLKYGKYWNMNISVSVYQQIINGDNLDPSAKNKLISWYGKIIQNFNLFQGNVIQLIANYNSPVATPQGTRIEVYNIDLGIRQKIFNGNGAVGLAVTDIFNTQRSGITAASSNFDYYRYFKIDTRAVLLTFTYSFKTKLREELMENKFLND